MENTIDYLEEQRENQRNILARMEETLATLNHSIEVMHTTLVQRGLIHSQINIEEHD